MFPDLYRAHHDLHREDLPFWLRLAQTSADPLLELGCGAGRVLIPLANSGHRVIGIERDAGMLTALRRQAGAGLLARIGLVQADFTRFCLAQRFGLALLPCNTYSTLAARERRQTLQAVRAHLLPGGVFAVAMPNPRLLVELPARAALQVEEIFPHPADGEPVQVSSGWRRARREFVLTWRYDHLLPDGTVESSSVVIRHQLAPPEAHRDEFRQAGFEQIDLLGDFDFSAFSPDAENLILIAR